MASLMDVSDENFEEEVLRADKPVLIDFWAAWCVPCKALGFLLEKIADEFQDRLKVVKFNVEENTKIPAKFGVRGLPTLLLFKSGQVAETLVGSQSKSSILQAVNKIL
jgi:thioredoxin 1